MPNPEPQAPTIFALASAPGRAGVAVFRISGPQARTAIARLCRPSDTPDPRTTSLRHLIDPETGETIDRAVVISFPAPNSYTGEDVIEFHVHGGRAVLNGVTESLRRLPGFRVAEPGEFTRRAFENGKLDLTEAEAVVDLVDAETTAQRRQALRQLEGELGRLYYAWADRLKHRLAYIEADIDFAEDELPEDIANKSLDDLRYLLGEIENHLDDHHRGERLREGFVVAILGPPNAGKSSLLNALAKREAAIVTPVPGTTRDVIEVHLDLGGYPVTLADTAGLRESADIIESEGVRRALARAADADLKILIFDGERWPKLDQKTQSLADKNTLSVINKSDLIPDIASTHSQHARSNSSPLAGEDRWGGERPGSEPTINSQCLFISALTGDGLPELTAALIKTIDERFALTGQPSLTRARHRAALEECRNHLRRALGNDVLNLIPLSPERGRGSENLGLRSKSLVFAGEGEPRNSDVTLKNHACEAPKIELCAEDVRMALRALGRITGHVDVEDLLDIIFSEFCIGK
jgi:tRNA modification GTPase